MYEIYFQGQKSEWKASFCVSEKMRVSSENVFERERGRKRGIFPFSVPCLEYAVLSFC